MIFGFFKENIDSWIYNFVKIASKHSRYSLDNEGACFVWYKIYEDNFFRNRHINRGARGGL